MIAFDLMSNFCNPLSEIVTLYTSEIFSNGTKSNTINQLLKSGFRYLYGLVEINPKFNLDFSLSGCLYFKLKQAPLNFTWFFFGGGGASLVRISPYIVKYKT